eukprot:TRINITY_DN6946_c0_g1_i1.p1 TRINITY_DN6946_c0_g1~~TRINITY_DN6946_c0_g1_i1.p1  ORF type:complete len:691 (-),score=136.09 TRINITY_DN6946_c0_g1_i1:99-2171(-)
MMDPKQREKCLKEVRLMQLLDHPNIIRYLDSFISDNELIIVTEWAELGDLKRLLKTAVQDDIPLEEPKIWEYLFQTSGAISHMHEKRIIHRDLKPANIFIAADGALKVGDLGLGRVFSSETVEAYSKVGTPLYMSPELLIGEGYDMKTDVWSLGCILYELCELKSPFRSEDEKMSLMDLFNKITKGEFKSISSKYSEDLRNLVNSMMTVDPRARIDMATVAKIAEAMLARLKKNPRIECTLVMEDIYEKLIILNYRVGFCEKYQRPLLHRYYFAFADSTPPDEKFYYFADLCTWIMELQKREANGKSQKLTLPSAMRGHIPMEECAQKLLEDVKSLGVKLPDTLGFSHIQQGSGEGVCYIVNDLLNRRLIMSNFRFELPDMAKADANSDREDGDQHSKDEHEEDMLLNLARSPKNFPDSEDELSYPDAEGKKNDTNQIGSALTTASDIFEVRGIDLIKERGESENADLAFINSNVNQEDWQKELLRVDKELEKIRNILETPGPNTFYNRDEHIFNIEFFQREAAKISEGIPHLRSAKFQKAFEIWEEQLNSISEGEARINKMCQGLLDELKSLLESGRETCEKYKSISIAVSTKIEELEVINKKLESANQEISNRSGDLNGNQTILEMQSKITKMKSEITSMNTRNGLTSNRLTQLEQQERKRNQAGKKRKVSKEEGKTNGQLHSSEEEL